MGPEIIAAAAAALVVAAPAFVAVITALRARHTATDAAKEASEVRALVARVASGDRLQELHRELALERERLQHQRDAGADD